MERTKRNAIEHYFKYGIAEERDCTCPPNFRSKTANDTAAICALDTSTSTTHNFDLGNGWLDCRPRLTNKVTVRHFPGEGKQLSAYRHCLKNDVRPHGHGWVAFLDVDEFLILLKHVNVVDFLLSYCEQGSPVTRRFQGHVWVKENIHVKTVSNVDAIQPGEPTNPHYACLIDGHHQLDTDGNTVSKMWNNEARPTDVALIYHYHTKSHKEYIGKRSRGRSDISGGKLHSTVARNLEAAKRGDYLLPTDYVDSSAWETLRLNNRYTIFDSLDIARQNLSHKQDNSSVSICALVSSQEIYINEWIDYHLALSVSRMYLFDSSNLRGGTGCAATATKVERVVFGNAKQLIYDPLPVTKRFQFRVGNEVGLSLLPVLLLTSPVPEKVLLKYLISEYWETKYCAIESTEPTDYYYTRSLKECRLQAGNKEICSLTGDVRDTSGWDKLQDLFLATAISSITIPFTKVVRQINLGSLLLTTCHP
eukprot:scaffold713_cov68-Cyclotella_meneghiniana.AAC.2